MNQTNPKQAYREEENLFVGQEVSESGTTVYDADTGIKTAVL